MRRWWKGILGLPFPPISISHALMLKPRLVLLAAFFSIAAPASSAMADIPPADVEACFGKKPGDACSGRGVDSGQCAQATCTTVRPGPNGIQEYHSDCVKCIPAAQPPPAKTDEPPSSPPPAPQKVAPGPTNKSSGCSVDSLGAQSWAGAGFALGLLGLFGWLRRKVKPNAN